MRGISGHLHHLQLELRLLGLKDQLEGFKAQSIDVCAIDAGEIAAEGFGKGDKGVPGGG